MLSLQRHALAGCLLPAGASLLRGLCAAAGDVVDEMVTYSREHYKASPDQAMDILKAGLSYHSQGPQAGRLYLAQADIEADRSRWPEVGALCRRAATTASDLEPSSPEEALLAGEVELGAECMGARAYLAQGKDAEAFKAAQTAVDVARKSFAAPGAEDRRWQGLVLASAVAGLVQHAAAEDWAAVESFEAVVALANHQDKRQGPPRQRDELVAPALKQAAAFQLALGDTDSAEALAARACAGAEAAAAAGRGSAAPMASPVVLGEALADARLLSAQVAIHGRQWEAAEERLGEALSAAERVGRERHPRVALVLLLLAHTYSRSGRVTLAEGLYREAARMLNLSPGSDADDVELKELHPSVGALLAWRYAQLLTALPNRGTEAGAWEQLGRGLHESQLAALGAMSAPENVFGSLQLLKGKGEQGRGVVLDLSCRRALPCSVIATLRS